MKRIIFFLLGFIYFNHTFSQNTANPGSAELKEKVIGWDKMMQPNGNAAKRSLVVDNKTYTSYQIGLIDTFSNWIKKSYIPIGGLPQPERIALPEGVNTPKYTPHGTGVGMAMWAPCYDKTGKGLTRAQPASADRITILTNHYKGFEEAAWFNTPTQFYFTSSLNSDGHYFDAATEQKANSIRKEVGALIGGNYMIYFGPGYIPINVVLMPGNKLPMIQVTREEVLTKAEEAVRRANSKGDMSQYLLDEALGDIRSLREKYKGKLNEPAIVNLSQISIYSFSKEADIFDQKKGDKYPYGFFKYTDEAYEAAKKDKPLWVNITFDYATDKSTTCRWEIYKAMTKNFNFAYVYDYFFNPEKVKGKAYQPLNAVSQSAATEKLNARETKASNQTKTFEPGVFYKEDFSDAVNGTLPAGWSSEQKNASFTIDEIAGRKGKWLKLNNWTNVFPSSIKQKLPDDFTITFDLLTTDFTAREGRMVKFLLKGESAAGKKDIEFRLNLQPGQAGSDRTYPGLSTVFLYLSTYDNRKQHEAYFNSFTNRSPLATVKIVKAGTTIKAFVNGEQVKADPKYQYNYEADTKLPESAVFTGFEWKNSNETGKSTDRGEVYISNVKVVPNK